MTFIRTISIEEAVGKVKEMYDADIKTLGYVANGTKAMSLRPDAYLAWEALRTAVRSKMRLRRYELVTLATASALHCTYWLLAHGALLRKNVFDATQLEAIVRDFHTAGLEPQEVAVMEFAEKITLHAHAIQREDVKKLRDHGLADEEILDVVMACAMRNFFSKVTDALGVESDMQYLELEPNVRKAMQKGRPFAEGEICPYCFGTHIIKTVRTSDGREEFFCEPCQMGGVLKPKNKYSEAQKLQILEHYERYSPQKIHDTFGVSLATLARWEKAKKKHAKSKNRQAGK